MATSRVEPFVFVFYLLFTSFAFSSSPLDDWLDVLSSGRKTDRQLPFYFLYDNYAFNDLFIRWDFSFQETNFTPSYNPNSVVRRLSFRWTEPIRKFGVVVNVTLFPSDFPTACEWILGFFNEGDASSGLLYQPETLRLNWPTLPFETVLVRSQHGSNFSFADFAHFPPLDLHINDDYFLKTTSSNAYLPFFAIQWSGSSQHRESSIYMSVGWSGLWKAKFQRTEEKVITSLGVDGVHTVLLPGENIRVLRALCVSWKGSDLQVGRNLYRQLMLKHYMRRQKNHQPFHVPIAGVAIPKDVFYPAGSINQSLAEKYIRHFRESNVEAYWLEANWFHGHPFPHGVGNWTIPINKGVSPEFPGGLGPVSEEVHNTDKHSMKFIVWFEPERVNHGTFLHKNYRSFLLQSRRSTPFLPPHAILDLSNPSAVQYLIAYFSNVIEYWHVDYIRWDINTDLVAAWQVADEPNFYRIGIAHIKHVMGLYEVWDKLYERYPNVIIDNCASGGRRIDLDTVMRSVVLWRTDYGITDKQPPAISILMTLGLSHFQPSNGQGVYFRGADPYSWRCAVTTGAVIVWDQLKDNKNEHYRLTKAIDETKKIRPFVQFGNLWQLTPLFPIGIQAARKSIPSFIEESWTVIQYHMPNQDKGIGLFFRHSRSTNKTISVSFREINETKVYFVQWYYEYGTVARQEMVRGRDLERLTVTLSNSPDSLLLMYSVGEEEQQMMVPYFIISMLLLVILSVFLFQRHKKPHIKE